MTDITIERAKFEQVLEALEEIALAGMSGTGQESEEAMTAWHARQAWKFIGIAARALEPIKQARSAPVQEPVATVKAKRDGGGTFVHWTQLPVAGMQLYTAAQRQWVGLTLTERNQLCRDIAASTHQVRAIEAKLKEKNHG